MSEEIKNTRNGESGEITDAEEKSNLPDKSVWEERKDDKVIEDTTMPASDEEPAYVAPGDEFQQLDEEEAVGVDEGEGVEDIDGQEMKGDGSRPTKLPWWKRPFARWFKRGVESEPKPSLGDGILANSLEGAVSKPPGTITSPGEALTPIPEEISSKIDLPTTENITLDELRALIKEEISYTQDDITRLVQAEMARQQEEHRRATLRSIQEHVENIYVSKSEILSTEMESLREESQLILKDRDRPLHERMEDVDYIRERLRIVEQEVAGLEEEAARRAIETDHARVELEGRGIVSDIRQELEAQKAVVADLPEFVVKEVDAQLSARGFKLGGLGLWPSLVILLLIVVMGVSGVLLPRQTKVDQALAGSSTKFIIDLATLYLATEDRESAIDLLDEAVEVGIDDAETLMQVGQTYFALRQFNKAIDVLEQAAENNPQNEEIRLVLARSYFETGQDDEAILHFEWLIEKDPENWRLHLETGKVYENMEDYNQAQAEYQKVTEINPNSIEGYTAQGNLYRSLELYDEAIKQYERVLEIEPNAWWTRYSLGKSYAGLQNWDQAIEQLSGAIEIAPDNFAPYLEMGRVWRAQGEYENALSWYQDALDINPNNVATLLEMGGTYEELGDCEQAANQFFRVLDINPNNKEAQEGLQACIAE